MVLIAVVGLLTYSNTFHVPFQFDDFPNLADNQLIRSLDNFISSSRGYHFNPRRFIGYLSFALNYHFGGLNVTGYHLINLAIHITSSLLVYLIVVLTFRTPFLKTVNGELNVNGEEVNGELKPEGKPFTIHDSLFTIYGLSSDSRSFIALFSALLFAVHPVQTQAVTYIVQRFASLAAMFYLLSVVAYIKARLALTTERTEESLDKKKPRIFSGSAQSISLCTLWLILSFLSAVLAMKTKETAFTLPVIIVLYEFTFFKSAIKKRLILIVPLLLTMLIIPISILGTNRPLGDIISDVSEALRVQTNLSRWDYLMTQMRVITTYIRLIFLPVNQNLDYNYPAYHSLFQPPVFLSFVFLSVILGTGVYLMVKQVKAEAKTESLLAVSQPQPLPQPAFRLIGFGILWFFITLSVESSFIPIADVIFEHRLYLPSAGAFVAVTTAAFMIAGRWKGMEKTVAIAFSIIIIALAGASYSRNAVWQDGTRLWEDVIRRSPGNVRAHNNLGSELMEKKIYDKAINEIRMALLLKPDYAEAHYNLGVIYQALNRFDEAVEHYQTAVKLKPDYAWAHLNLGFIYYKAFNKADKAEEEFLTAAGLMPDLAEAHFNLGLIYQSSNRPDKAIEQYLIDIKLRPDHVTSHNNLGSVYYKTGQVEKARKELAVALKIEPDNVTTQNLLKEIYTNK